MLSGDTDTLFRKVRSRSDYSANSPTECGIIMVHRDAMQQKISARQCARLGFHPIVVDLPPSKDAEEVSDSINRLEETIAVESLALQLLGKSMRISYIVVDANYSHRGSDTPNYALLAFMRDELECKHIFASSYAPECLKNLRAAEDFKEIHVTDDPTTDINTIMTKDNSTQRKHSLGMK